MTMTTTLRSTISPFVIAQAALVSLFFVSEAAFVNAETAFICSFLILLGSMYSYRRLVKHGVMHGAHSEEADALTRVDDPYELYEDDVQVPPADDRLFKEVIKEEKAKLKANRHTVRNVTKSTPALMSIYRLIPYGILIMGFIALKNNEMLLLWYYLPGLAVGIVAALFSGKALFGARY